MLIPVLVVFEELFWMLGVRNMRVRPLANRLDPRAICCTVISIETSLVRVGIFEIALAVRPFTAVIPVNLLFQTNRQGPWISIKLLSYLLILIN